MQLVDAVNTFARGFSAGRSITHPYIVKRPGGGRLWVCQDGPGKRASDERTREYVALGLPAKQVVDRVTRDGQPRHVLCAVHDGMGRDGELEAAYKALGYRYLKPEPLMVRALPPAPRGGSATQLMTRRVRTQVDAAAVATAAGRRQINVKFIGDDAAPARLFATFDGPTPVGWVCSIRVDEATAWVANLYVSKTHRRRGIATALMKTMLRDDGRRGVRYSVLTASSAGAHVYRQIGYEQVGTVQLFSPMR
jgi:GNAT superfamily N-acetyltransferase